MNCSQQIYVNIQQAKGKDTWKHSNFGADSVQSYLIKFAPILEDTVSQKNEMLQVSWHR